MVLFEDKTRVAEMRLRPPFELFFISYYIQDILILTNDTHFIQNYLSFLIMSENSAKRPRIEVEEGSVDPKAILPIVETETEEEEEEIGITSTEPSSEDEDEEDTYDDEEAEILREYAKTVGARAFIEEQLENGASLLKLMKAFGIEMVCACRGNLIEDARVFSVARRHAMGIFRWGCSQILQFQAKTLGIQHN